jgi:hypothetical protein
MLKAAPSAGRPVRCWPSLKRHGSGSGSGSRRAGSPRALVDLVSSLAHIDLQHIAQHAPLAYEPIALPCSLQRCGDVVHRRCAARARCRALLFQPEGGRGPASCRCAGLGTIRAPPAAIAACSVTGLNGLQIQGASITPATFGPSCRCQHAIPTTAHRRRCFRRHCRRLYLAAPWTLSCVGSRPASTGGASRSSRWQASTSPSRLVRRCSTPRALRPALCAQPAVWPSWQPAFAQAASGRAAVPSAAGVLPGAIDYYILGPLQRKMGKVYGMVRSSSHAQGAAAPAPGRSCPPSQQPVPAPRLAPIEPCWAAPLGDGLHVCGCQQAKLGGASWPFQRAARCAGSTPHPP